MKYIVVTGGVVSGLGKGVTISSLGKLLQACGLTVTCLKIDPYLNVDAGTMSPFEHGEVFVLNDGGECDLDLGNYERFLDLSLTSDHNITTGKIYRKVILKERQGQYLGKTVQVVPHITNEIQDWIENVAHLNSSNSNSNSNNSSNSNNNNTPPPDVCLIEVGGTVGDIESSVFLEALRQFQFRVGNENFCLCFVSLVPTVGTGGTGEQKTKPTQHGVKDLRSLGLNPQIIFCRSTEELLPSTKEKISNFCHVREQNIISVYDVNNIYHVPLLLQKQNLHTIVQKILFPNTQHPKVFTPDLTTWSQMANSITENTTKIVKIALIGKYTGLQDSYLSVIKALKHASVACKHQLDLLWIEATHLEEQNNKEEYAQAWDKLKSAQGIVVPGGFGDRGFLGKILAVQYCRLQKIPFLGICLGFQAMVVEYSRNVLGWTDANSAEFDTDTPHDVVIFMPEIDKEHMGGTMRLGARETKFTHRIPSFVDYASQQQKQGIAAAQTTTSTSTEHNQSQLSLMQTLYTKMKNYKTTGEVPATAATEEILEVISERHRHRYEVNPKFVEQIQNSGLIFVGRDADFDTVKEENGNAQTEEPPQPRMEIAELPTYIHPYFVGVQYHPEFKSRPLKPSPPFYGLIASACGMSL